MRIALISDIHGNLVALEALLGALKRAAPDQVICLGDIAATGPQPHEVVSLLRELRWPIVMGNTDDWLLNPVPDPDAEESMRIIEEIELWSAAQLTDEDREFIRAFPATLEVPLGDQEKLLCYHGSPRSFHDEILPSTPVEQLEAWFLGSDAICFAGGHTHERMVRSCWGSTVLNPGSVGLPQIVGKDGTVRNPIWAEYALLDWENGRLNIQLCCEPFSRDALLQSIRTSTMPHGAVYAQDWH